MCWASAWPTPTRWPTAGISPPSLWAAASSFPVTNSWNGSTNRPRKNLKYCNSYFGNSVVCVCVEKGGIINGKETSQRRGQHPQKAKWPLGGQIYLGHRPGHRQGHPEKRVRQDPGGVQRKAGESHSGKPRYPAQPHRRLHRSGMVSPVV